jgi:P pilus assembly chaperone PapD
LVAAAPFVSLSSPAQAGIGDLLVAPTRIVLDGRKGAEVVLNNIGEEPAVYRVSVEFRRMKPDGTLEDVTTPTAADQTAEDMIVYAPRRVTLAPHEPQSIRIAARPPAGLPDGEYRVHLLFRAIPPANPVVKPTGEPEKGLRFQLTPVYGVTIPVIVRLGNLQATAGIANVQRETGKDGNSFVSLDLSRTGTRSTFGEVRVFKAGVKNPIALQKAVAVYTEVNTRHVDVPVDPAFKGELAGPVTVQYVETFDDGSHVIAETQAVLR